jgi:hypothetical protein
MQSKQSVSRLSGTFMVKSDQVKRISTGKFDQKPKSSSQDKAMDKTLLGRKRLKAERLPPSSSTEAQACLKRFVDLFLEWGCYTGLNIFIGY